MTREETVLSYLDAHGIAYTHYSHPEGRTIAEARRWWRDDGSAHCKNLFFRNHKGDRHYLVCLDCMHDLDIHDLERRLRERLTAQGLPSCGKLSFASRERMERYLGLEPGSVSPFGLINDTENHVRLFLDQSLKDAATLSFHPNDCRGTVVLTREDFTRYLDGVGNEYEYLPLY